MGKAAYGALMGLGEGISDYGKTLTADTLSRQKEQRELDRQASLQQIRQQFQMQLQQNTQQFQTDLRDEKRAYEEAREMELLDPNSDLYQAKEAERARLAKEKQDQELERINARGDSYSTRSALPSLSQLSAFTDESRDRAISEYKERVNAGEDPSDAWFMAQQALESKDPNKSSGVETKITSAVVDGMKGFAALDIDSKRYLLESKYPNRQLDTASEDVLDRLYQQYLMNYYGGLMENDWGNGGDDGPLPAGNATKGFNMPGQQGPDPSNPLGLSRPGG